MRGGRLRGHNKREAIVLGGRNLTGGTRCNTKARTCLPGLLPLQRRKNAFRKGKAAGKMTIVNSYPQQRNDSDGGDRRTASPGRIHRDCRRGPSQGLRARKQHYTSSREEGSKNPGKRGGLVPGENANRPPDVATVRTGERDRLAEDALASELLGKGVGLWVRRGSAGRISGEEDHQHLSQKAA